MERRTEIGRREFIGAAALAAGGVLTGRGAVPPPAGKDGFIWAALLHMGTNTWCDQILDQIPSSWGPYKGDEIKLVSAADHVRFDERVWRTVTDRMVKVGMNMVIIDLGEAIQYPSHPELWVKGSWEIERFRKELARLRAMGLEPIPKMNFSAAHDIWLKQYERMLSTKKYYEVCSDLIRDVCDIFDHPRFLHLGCDEETVEHQRKYLYCAVRQGDLWWNDFLWFVKETEKTGMRPWIWSDYVWHHPDLFFSRMPRSVLQSNWYYSSLFSEDKLKAAGKEKYITYVKAYELLDKAGFDQVPTGSNWSHDDNFAGTVDYCRRVCAPDRLKGFMMAPWFFTLPGWEKKLLEGIDQVEAEIKKG